jgi:cold shock CspA family protein
MALRTAWKVCGVFVLSTFAAPLVRAFQETTRVSVDSTGAQANTNSDGGGLSADGRIVVFQSYASNIVTGDTNGRQDIFVHDRSTGATERVSVGALGVEANGYSTLEGGQPISADGTRVVFTSNASNLDPNDTNNTYDVFVHDRSTGTTTCVSVDLAGNPAKTESRYGVISADGRFVAFQSFADDLVSGDQNYTIDVFVRDLVTGTTELVSVDAYGNQGNGGSYSSAISADGRYVAFSSAATNLVASDTNGKLDVFVRDRATGTVELVSVDSAGNPSNDHCALPSMSDDGDVVAFETGASNLAAGDTNGRKDIYVRARAAGTTVRASVDSYGAQGDLYSYGSVMDPGGRCVAFTSFASTLVAGDTNGAGDAFVHDLVHGTTVRASVDSSGGQADCFSGACAVRGGGRVVAFASCADDLVASDTNNTADVFVHDLCGTLASWTNYGAGVGGTFGVPGLTATQLPSFGASLDVVLANSLQAPTPGLLVIGLQRGDFHSKFGDVLVVPALIVPIAFAYGGVSFTGAIPDDLAMCGATLDLQGIEVDAGAPHGMSFSEGLELVIGS